VASARSAEVVKGCREEGALSADGLSFLPPTLVLDHLCIAWLAPDWGVSVVVPHRFHSESLLTACQQLCYHL
jgi:hypothetical protein